MSTESVSPRSRRSFQQEIAPSQERRPDRSRRSPDQDSSDTQRTGRGRSRRRPEPPPAQAAPVPASPSPVSTQPVSTPVPVVTPPTEERTLAERYVAQYESQSGNSLTEEQRSAKVDEIEKFYLSRQGRLDTIVFA